MSKAKTTTKKKGTAKKATAKKPAPSKPERKSPVETLTGPATGVTELPIKQVNPAPDNVRTHVVVDDEFVASVKNGIIQPLVVRGDGNGAYQVIAGHRRLAAAKKAKLATVPVVIREDVTDEQRVAAMLVENLHRDDLAPLDEAGGYQRLVDEFGWSQRRVAQQVNRSQAHVSKRLSLLELTDTAKKALSTGDITLEEALELKPLADHPQFMDRAVTGYAKVREQGRTMRQVVNALATEISFVERRNEARQALQKAGVKIVSDAELRKTDLWQMKRDKHGADLRSIPGVDPKKHAKEKCHGALITHEGDVLEVCTKPANHKQPSHGSEDSAGSGPASSGKTAKPSPEDVEREKEQELRRQQDEAADQAYLDRIDAERKFLAGKKMPKEQILTHVAGYLVTELIRYRSDPDHVLLVLLLLGAIGDDADIDELPGEQLSAQMEAAESMLLDMVGQGPDGAAKVAAAITLAEREDMLGGLYRRLSDWTEPETRRHFDFLEARGYEPSEVEKLRLRGEAAGQEGPVEQPTLT